MVSTKVKLLREVTLMAQHFFLILNFTQLACTKKFKIEPKCATVKVTSLSEVEIACSFKRLLFSCLLIP